MNSIFKPTMLPQVATLLNFTGKILTEISRGFLSSARQMLELWTAYDWASTVSFNILSN
jgi:hypothetical protein